jgi:LmbE family N-acetylglucosaminyl deacetylase
MKLTHTSADVFVPQRGLTIEEALARVTHLSVAAHQDDIEIMAYEGIADCFGHSDRWFAGVVVTDGAGSPRTGPYAHLTDAEMQAVRREEQRKAAVLGEYSICIQLSHPSSAAKDPENRNVTSDLVTIFSLCRPQIVYLHNPADKHDTHVAVLLRAIEAMRTLPPSARPKKVLGCEVWRDLDWLSDNEKQTLDVSLRPNLAAALLGVFDSQISGGKRYDLAAVARRVANATFHASHAADEATALTWALDLTPLLIDPTLSVETYTLGAIDRFRADVQRRLRRFA